MLSRNNVLSKTITHRKIILFGPLILLFWLPLWDIKVALETDLTTSALGGLNADTPLIFTPQQTQQTKPQKYRVPDGEFYGIPLYFVPRNQTESSAYSSVHCVGNNFRKDAWFYRSCDFQNLCFDIKDQEYFLAPSREQLAMEKAMRRANWTARHGSSSTTMHGVTVQIKSMQHGYFDGSLKAYPEWFPKLKALPIDGYYELPDEFVWVPIRTLTVNTLNPGHLIWDYFLPIFNLISIFGHDKDRVPLITDHNPFCKGRRGLKNGCLKMMSKFLPLLGTPPYSLNPNIENITFSFNATPSHVLCAPHGAAGIGMLNDHGKNKHGTFPTDYENGRNVGRGPEFYRFRNFMLRNMGLMQDVETQDDILLPPYQIVLSLNSSNSPSRRFALEAQTSAIKQNFDPAQVVTKPLVLADLPLREQLRLVSQSAVLITVMGGGNAFATFLPRGSTLIVFFDDVNEWVLHSKNKKRLHPVMMDWDFLNNAAHITVHWFPISTMNTEADLKVLVATIRNDIERRMRELRDN